MAEVMRRMVWRPRFSLWTMLVVITLCAPFLAYVASIRKWNHDRKQAYDDLLAKGVLFRPSGRPNLKAKAEASFFQKTWKSLTADPHLPSFGIVILSPSTDSITEDDLRSLTYFPEIEEFHCDATADVTDGGLGGLSELPNLKMVVCSDLPRITGAFLVSFRDHTKLEYLGLHNCRSLEGEQLTPLRQLKSLTQLNLSRLPSLTDHSLREVDLPKSLARLYVGQVKLGDETLARWLSQVQFKFLYLHAPITRDLAPAFTNQRAIEDLGIVDAPLIDEDFAFLKDCQQLGRLSLNSMPVRGELLAFVPHPEKIHHLNFSNTLFSDEHLAKLSRFPNLSGLDLAWTPLTGEGFQADMGLPRPGMFFLTGVRFSDQGKEVFSKFKGLQTVQLPSNWSPADYQRFADSDKPANPQFNSYFNAVPGGQTYGPPTLRQEPMKNCPTDLMKPVADLHALGVAEEEEIQRRQAGSP